MSKIEKNETSDILQPISEECLMSMLITLKAALPRSIGGHHFLYLHTKGKLATIESTEVSERCQKVCYTLKNCDPKNCTYISISGSKDYWIFLYTLEHSGEELIRCLKETKRINWKNTPIVISVEEQLFESVDRVCREKNSEWKYDTPEGIYFLPKTSVLSLTIDIPEGTYLAPIKLQHADVINEEWLYKYYGSLNLLRTLIKTVGGTGLFKSKTNELVAWAITTDFFCPGFWHTIESERKKGYGSVVYKAECIRFAGNFGMDILAHIVDGNFVSERLLKNIGFCCVGRLRWIERY